MLWIKQDDDELECKCKTVVGKIIFTFEICKKTQSFLCDVESCGCLLICMPHELNMMGTLVASKRTCCTA